MKKLILILIGLVLLAWCCTSWAASLQVSWDANTESDLAGYKVYYGTVSGAYGTSADVGNVTSYQIPSIAQEGQTIYVAVTAYDTAGNESGFSNEVSVFVPDSTAPAPPKGLIARIIDALVSWLRGLFGLTARVV